MNLEEAIKHCEEVANRKPYFDDKLGGMVYPEGAINTLEEHGQYAEWLKELKQMRKAIEDIKTDIDKFSRMHMDGDYYVKTFDVKDVIDRHISEVGMSEQMEFPETFDNFAKEYGFKDDKEVYTNGSDLIPIFRVKQWIEHINKPTQMIDKSNFDKRQYRADLDTAYQSGRASVFTIIDDIKADIEQYEADCMLHCPDDEVCKDCNKDMFKSIYSIIDKHISGKGGELDGTGRT